MSRRAPATFTPEVGRTFQRGRENSAVKAAGKDGRIQATGEERGGGQIAVRVENTGQAVDPRQSERLFRPFESTTLEVDPVLGQGMGMGLPITRNMLEEYGAEIRFVIPSRGFAAAVEIEFS